MVETSFRFWGFLAPKISFMKFFSFWVSSLFLCDRFFFFAMLEVLDDYLEGCNFRVLIFDFYFFCCSLINVSVFGSVRISGLLYILSENRFCGNIVSEDFSELFFWIRRLDFYTSGPLLSSFLI